MIVSELDKITKFTHELNLLQQKYGVVVETHDLLWIVLDGRPTPFIVTYDDDVSQYVLDVRQ